MFKDHRFLHDVSNMGGTITEKEINQLITSRFFKVHTHKINLSIIEFCFYYKSERLHVRIYRTFQFPKIEPGLYWYSAHTETTDIIRHFYNHINKIPSDYKNGNLIFPELLKFIANVE